MTSPRRLSPSYNRPASAHPAIAPEDLTLAAVGNAAALAVLFARRIAIAWGFAYHADLAETVTHELLTRAIELTGIADPPPRHGGMAGEPPPLAGVRVTLVRAGLLIEVWDSVHANPLPADPANLDDRLKVVHEAAGRWNSYRAPGGGKVIWAEIRHQRNEIDGLAQREPGAYSFPDSANLPERETRPAVMRAVAVGLRQLGTGGAATARRWADRGSRG